MGHGNRVEISFLGFDLTALLRSAHGSLIFGILLFIGTLSASHSTAQNNFVKPLIIFRMFLLRWSVPSQQEDIPDLSGARAIAIKVQTSSIYSGEFIHFIKSTEDFPPSFVNGFPG